MMNYKSALFIKKTPQKNQQRKKPFFFFFLINRFFWFLLWMTYSLANSESGLHILDVCMKRGVIVIIKPDDCTNKALGG